MYDIYSISLFNNWSTQCLSPLSVFENINNNLALSYGNIILFLNICDNDEYIISPCYILLIIYAISIQAFIYF